MRLLTKSFSLLLLVLLAASSLIMIKAAFAQSIPNPSIPDFTINITNHSSDTPSAVSTDPYTGENVTNLGSHYEWRTLDLTMKNQPFTQDAYGVEFYYFVRMKGHFSNEWNELSGPSAPYTQKTGSQNTVISFALSGKDASASGLRILTIPSNGQADFQVDALIGNIHRTAGIFAPWDFSGVDSGWSNIQTINITDGAVTIIPNTSTPPIYTSFPTPTPSPTNIISPTPTSTVPEFSWLAILPLLLAVFSIAVIVIRRKPLS